MMKNIVMQGGDSQKIGNISDVPSISEFGSTIFQEVFVLASIGVLPHPNDSLAWSHPLIIIILHGRDQKGILRVRSLTRFSLVASFSSRHLFIECYSQVFSVQVNGQCTTFKIVIIPCLMFSFRRHLTGFQACLFRYPACQ